jgi:hypothetical protein
VTPAAFLDSLKIYLWSFLLKLCHDYSREKPRCHRLSRPEASPHPGCFERTKPIPVVFEAEPTNGRPKQTMEECPGDYVLHPVKLTKSYESS